jgi:hypothetical protein
LTHHQPSNRTAFQHHWREATIAIVVASQSIKNGTNIPTEKLEHAIPGAKLPSHTDSSMTLHTGKMTNHTDKRTLQANRIIPTETK